MNPDAVPPDIARLGAELPHFPDGRIDYTDSGEAAIMNCYILHEGKLLLVKRSDKVGWLKGRWHVVGGFLDQEVTLREKALEEIGEELGSTEQDVLDLRALPMVVEEGPEKRWILYRVIIHVRTDTVRLDWENTEHAWVRAEELGRYGLLPGVQLTAQDVLAKGADARRADHTSGG